MTDWRVHAVVEGEPHDGFVLARTQNEAISAFLEDFEGEVEEVYAERVHHVLVKRLRDYEGMNDPWGVEFDWKLLDEITKEDVARAKESHDSLATSTDDRIDDPKWHAARILYLTRHQDRLLDPIEIDNECHGGAIYPIPKIIDGWHRFFAHLYLGYERIRCTYGGLVDLLEYLEGKVDEPPEF